MTPISLALSELIFRWKTGFLFALIIALITGAVAYFSVNNSGFQREISRNARDIGSNVVILPIDVDQLEYHLAGGFSEITMSGDIVQQLLEHKASLNHLIPMLERESTLTSGTRQATARVVGLSASIPMPGRPKAPMQKAIQPGQIQLGSVLANQLGIQREQRAEVEINGNAFLVSRVNKANGTWQDAAAILDLETAQTLFNKTGQVSRIEAIECTSEQCELTGLKSDVVLANELARITDQAAILRRDQMAEARSSIRMTSRENLLRLQYVLWILLAVSVVALSGLNSFQRRSEIGVLQSLGYGPIRVVTVFLLRSLILATVGTVVGVSLGAWIAQLQGQSAFGVTGKKLIVDWMSAGTIGLVAITLATLATCLPTFIAANKHPADVIRRDA